MLGVTTVSHLTLLHGLPSMTNYFIVRSFDTKSPSEDGCLYGPALSDNPLAEVEVIQAQHE